MPTKIFTKQAIGSVTHKNVTYPVKNGAVEVPDDAVETLCESHGFTKDDAVKSGEVGTGTEPAKFDLAMLTKNQLIEKGVELGAELKTNMSKDEIFAIVKPLWEAAELEKSA